MHFNEYQLTKKEKKKRLNKKNRVHEQLFQLMRMRRAEAQRKKDHEKLMKPKQAASPNSEWSDKVSKVRNRLTGKKRESKERWNRFAGTSDGGGRGL